MLRCASCHVLIPASFSLTLGMPFKTSYVLCLAADKILQLCACCFAYAHCQTWLQGAQAYAAKVEFPKDEEALGCTVLVGSMNPQVTIEQVSLCRRICGTVVAPCKVIG